jgi:hypothetical protein
MNDNNNYPVTTPSPQGEGWGGALVNAHLHTPYSFSAFETIEQALDMAVSENVKVVGINDFNTMDGYASWSKECSKRKLYPLFNIELIGLNKEDQEAGIQINDPINPGRTYLSGKGLAYPSKLEEPFLSQLNKITNESNHHVEKMCGKLNELLVSINAPFPLHFNIINDVLTEGIIRERHLAKGLRLTIGRNFPSDEKQQDFYKKLFGGKALKSNIADAAGIENEIRKNLLKAGGTAFVPENNDAFPEVEDIRQIILHAGGIPTYPFLADDPHGNFTDFEEDKEIAVKILKNRGIFSVEFITTRNTIAVLEDYAGYCWDNGMVVTFGSEHNTPAMEPIRLSAANGVELTPKLMDINYNGACIIVAHQHLNRIGEQGYIDEDGLPNLAKRDEFVKVGNEIIKASLTPPKEGL